MEPQITILTPSYNRAELLPRLYESLCNQTYQNFLWLIMDDGSTDHTKELVQKWKVENKLQIEYHWHENVKKLITTVRGFHRIKTPYLYSVDSDDTLPHDALQILFDEMEKVKDDDRYSAVIGRIEDQFGELKGDPFPYEPFDADWFLLVNHYKIKGPHEGIQKTKCIKKTLPDVEKYAGKGYVYDVWNFYLDANHTTRFINQLVYTYHFDENDAQSLTNTKYRLKNAYGLSETSYHFINAYSKKYFRKYPIPILKQLFQYMYFGKAAQISADDLYKKLDNRGLKFYFGLFYIPVGIYSWFKPLK